MQPSDIRNHIAVGVYSLIGLHARLHCSVCRSRGGMGKNVSLFPVERGK